MKRKEETKESKNKVRKTEIKEQLKKFFQEKYENKAKKGDKNGHN